MGSTTTESAHCPLCDTIGSLHHRESNGVFYLLCPTCGLIWLSPEFRIQREAEFRHYLTHENNPADPRYRNFLNQLWLPLRERLKPGSRGLDYGSGPGPTLHLMACQDGFPCEPFDPIFDPHRERLDRTYDFVTCSETAEHFFRPDLEFKRLHRLLRPSGWLALMTLMVPDNCQAFGSWHYRLDPTHVCFYQAATVEWIAHRFGFEGPKFESNRVVLLRKGA